MQAFQEIDIEIWNKNKFMRFYVGFSWCTLAVQLCDLWGDNQSGLNCAKQVSVTDNQSGTSHSVTCSDYLCHTSVNLSNSWIWNSSELHQFLQVLRCNEIRLKSQGDIFYFCIFVFESFLAFSFWWIVAGIFICLYFLFQ